MNDDKHMPRRFRIPADVQRPFDKAYRYGVYFPGTDLVVFDMGQRMTGEPTHVEWLDPMAVSNIDTRIR